MSAQWTGEIIGKMHLNNITGIRLAQHLGYNPKYVSMVLNGHKTPKKAEEIFRRGVDEMIELQKIRPAEQTNST